MLDALTLWPISCSAVASFSWLFETHRSGRIGSPIVAVSSNCRRSSSNVGSLVVIAGRPAPFRRTLPANEPGSLRSLMPRPMVLRATLVARDVAATPPCPAVRASAAACNRRPRSSSDRRTAWYRVRMGFSSIMNPQYAALRALGIPAGHHDATRFVYFWAPPKGTSSMVEIAKAAGMQRQTVYRLKDD